MRLIGDVHGKVYDYYKIIENVDESIQLGDFGFKKQHLWFLKTINTTKHKILFGNHDYYPYLYSKHSLGDFGLYKNMFFVRGAYSIDKMYRVEGRDWFSDEELKEEQCVNCLELYEREKPEIVISHDVPNRIRFRFFGIYQKSITTNLLEMMFTVHKPKIWVFGHHHYSINEVYDGTKFICLDELEYIDI